MPKVWFLYTNSLQVLNLQRRIRTVKGGRCMEGYIFKIFANCMTLHGVRNGWLHFPEYSILYLIWLLLKNSLIICFSTGSLWEKWCFKFLEAFWYLQKLCSSRYGTCGTYILCSITCCSFLLAKCMLGYLIKFVWYITGESR